MQRYSELQPTTFDQRGLNWPGQQDSFVVPVSQTRDSEALDRANFQAALESLGGESETVEVHRFGHWGPGWFEIVIVSPERVAEVEAIEARLDGCPVLDEELFSRLEDEDCETTWSKCYSPDERLEYFRRHSYTSTGLCDMLRAIKGGDWGAAANMLHCPSDLLA